MAQPVVHFEISGKSGAKSRAFYAKLFGWEFNEVPEMDYGLVAPGESGIGGGVGKTPDGVAPFATFYVQTDDLQADLDKAESLGGKIAVPPTPIPGGGSIAQLTDPDGITVGLYKPE